MPTGFYKRIVGVNWFPHQGFASGHKPTAEVVKKIKDARKKQVFQEEEKSYAWKGDKIGYSGIHMWVRKSLGTPEICENCKKEGLKGMQIHWANKDHTYKRNLKDWIRLCARCHKKYDLKFNVGLSKKESNQLVGEKG